VSAFGKQGCFADDETLPGAWPPAKADLPGVILCRESLALAFGKEILCRVPDKKLPAKDFPPGKSPVSCSARS